MALRPLLYSCFPWVMPLQSLLDLYTIQREIGRLENFKIGEGLSGGLEMRAREGGQQSANMWVVSGEPWVCNEHQAE